MKAMAKEPGCGEVAETVCCAVPAEFSRVRYFFGQRLGVVDLADEQRYHAGKNALHNLRLHGAGVVCGLQAERFVWPAGAPPATPATILRVTRGFALDACGREVVVPVDQCIDVAAWVSANRDRLPEPAPDPNEEGGAAAAGLTLVLAVRYRECPSDPAPAPRDPCGCDAGGCEFSRVREGFELALFPPAEQEDLCGPAPGPSAEDLSEAFAASDPEEALKLLLGASCGDAPCDPWLCLARIPVELDAAGNVVDLGPPDNAPPERAFLLSTAAIQALLLAGASPAAAPAALPRFGGWTFKGLDGESGELSLALELAPGAAPGTVTPLVAATFAKEYVRVAAFDSTNGWKKTTKFSTGYDPAGPAIRVKVGGLEDGRRYRVSVEAPHETPIADEAMRELHPRRFAAQFEIERTGNDLTAIAVEG